jgi:hypothetical protein
MTFPSWKKSFVTGIIGSIVAGAALLAQAVPSPLGMNPTAAQSNLLDSLTQGNLVTGGAARAFIALPTAARVAVVHDGLAWARAYVDSAAFKSAYDKRRENQKPEAPSFTGTVDDELKAKQDEQKKQLAQSRTMLASLPADQRASLEAVFKQTEAQMSDPAYVAMVRQSIEIDRAKAQKEYQSSLADWQRDYPADPKILVARRLQAFMALSATVDFAAKTEGTGTGKTFVNPDYQQKSGDWKMCYRAGKESVDAARAAVTEWLKVLPKP